MRCSELWQWTMVGTILFKFTITSQGLKLKIVFGCIRGCSATQSQAEKGRDSIPPIEDEHQQFRPVFSCNPILSAVKQNLWYGVMHLQLPNTHLGFVPMRLLFFKHPYLANESKFPFWNGGHVLRWRGPFFFLPTNQLNNGIISLLGWLSHRHRGTQLATTSNYPCQP